MPSSPMRTLPRPSTSVFTGSFVTLLPVKLPSTYDRRDCAPALNVVVIEGKVNVHDDKCNKEPQEQMVPVAHVEFPAHQRHDPGEHAWKPRIAHAGIEREARNGLGDKREECQKVDKRRQRVVPGGDFAVHLRLQNISLDDVDNLFLLLLRNREEIIPPGVFVPTKPQ